MSVGGGLVEGGGAGGGMQLEMNAGEQEMTCLPLEPTREFHPPTAWTKPMSS